MHFTKPECIRVSEFPYEEKCTLLILMFQMSAWIRIKGNPGYRPSVCNDVKKKKHFICDPRPTVTADKPGSERRQRLISFGHRWK